MVSTTGFSVINSRYAGVLADLAEESKSVSKIQKDIGAIAEMLAESVDFKTFISSPLLSKRQQSEAMSTIAKKAKLQSLTQDFLQILIENGRLKDLGGIAKAFQHIVAKRSGEVTVQVQTAEKMTASQEKKIAQKIASVIGADVSVEAEITPEILGGMIVTIGSFMVDDSVRRKLQRLENVLKQGANQNSVQNLKEVV